MSQHLTHALRPITEPIDLTGLDIPHPAPFLCSITVDSKLLSETVAHLSNIQYVSLLDRAAELAADAAGFCRTRLLEEDRMWFVARHEIDYLKEVIGGQELFIATWVRDVRRVKSWRQTLMFIAHPDITEAGDRPNIIVCRAATLWVLVNLSSRKPMSMDQEMIDRFAPVEMDTRKTLLELE
jgi:acyl-CoA thioesterase FadM